MKIDRVILCQWKRKIQVLKKSLVMKDILISKNEFGNTHSPILKS